MEYSWNPSHEDLSKARVPGALIPNGTPQDPYPSIDVDHGTAVLGIISGDANGIGVTGIVPAASLNMVNTVSSEGGWNIANAIYTAVAHMNSGDVMTIEQQTYGPSSDPNNFVPAEWIPEVYDAITYASAKNITVVEPAGNGGQNLDDTTLYGSTFPAGKPDSGAIIVGAGEACNNGTPLRSRLSFSDYGKRVNLQGLGDCVVTTGYGSLYNGGPNALYTSSFNGTSSATPTVAGPAASFVSAYKTLNGGVAPTTAVVRSTLLATGTPQNTGIGSIAGSIGPLPNLAKALLATDLVRPTTPAKLTASLNVSKKVVLKWGISSDNVGVVGYRLYRNNILIQTLSPRTTFTDTTVAAKKTYQYRMTAIDQAGHASPFSNTVTITVK